MQVENKSPQLGEEWKEYFNTTLSEHLSNLSHENKSEKNDVLAKELGKANMEKDRLSKQVEQLKATALQNEESLKLAQEKAEKLKENVKQQQQVTEKGSTDSLVWQGTTSNVASNNGASWKTVQLQCPAMRSGFHKWSVLVSSPRYVHMLLGVASTEHEMKTDMVLINQAGGWSLSCDGSVFHNGKFVSRGHGEFTTGSKVTFVLDLTGNGTLTASIDGKPATTLFSDKLSEFEGLGKKGFVPAVSMCEGERVRLLGFDFCPCSTHFKRR
jgi:hypothetical protein